MSLDLYLTLIGGPHQKFRVSYTLQLTLRVRFSKLLSIGLFQLKVMAVAPQKSMVSTFDTPTVSTSVQAIAFSFANLRFKYHCQLKEGLATCRIMNTNKRPQASDMNIAKSLIDREMRFPLKRKPHFSFLVPRFDIC